jgi:hypothetical protein
MLIIVDLQESRRGKRKSGLKGEVEAIGCPMERGKHMDMKPPPHPPT